MIRTLRIYLENFDKWCGTVVAYRTALPSSLGESLAEIFAHFDAATCLRALRALGKDCRVFRAELNLVHIFVL
jgi:hypothetical protein